jgi:predicted nucleic acid-binding protein
VIVVPDAGPLIYLAGADKLDLLSRLFDRVVVPRAVYDVIVVAGAGLMGSDAVSAASWLEIDDAPPDATLAQTLDLGEAAAIPLAERLSATLLCDDAAARAEARRRGSRS